MFINIAGFVNMYIYSGGGFVKLGANQWAGIGGESDESCITCTLVRAFYNVHVHVISTCTLKFSLAKYWLPACKLVHKVSIETSCNMEVRIFVRMCSLLTFARL